MMNERRVRLSGSGCEIKTICNTAACADSGVTNPFPIYAGFPLWIRVCRIISFTYLYRSFLSFSSRFPKHNVGAMLNFSAIWRGVVIFTPRPLYPRRKNPMYPFVRQGGYESRPGRFGEVKNIAPTGSPACIPSLYRLLLWKIIYGFTSLWTLAAYPVSWSFTQ
jgi:hypothetical protein